MTVSRVTAQRPRKQQTKGRRIAALLLLALGCGLGTPARADMASAQSAIAAGNFPAAGAALAPLAEAGDPQAQYQWAALALDGHPVGLEANRALSLLIQSAAQGNSHAAARLGLAYANGDQVAVDKLAAYHWLSRANAAPDLTPAEREQVTALQQSLLEELAPQQTAYRSDSPDAASQPAPAPAPTKTKKAPAPEAKKGSPTTVADIQMPQHTPLLQPDDPVPTDAGSNDAAATAGTDKSSKTADAKTATAATETEPAPAVAAPVPPVAIAAVPVSAGPVTSGTGKSVYMVQMASLPSANAATAEASRLRKKYAKLLQGTEVSVRPTDLGSKGVMQRVVAGPYDTLVAAKDQCAQLSAQKQACRVFKTSN